MAVERDVYSGHGSYAVFAVTVSAVTTYYLIDTVTNEKTREGKVNEYTDSASGGYAQGLGRVLKGGATLECNDDSEASLDAQGVPELTFGDLYVRRGELEAFDLLEGTTYASYSRTTENQDGQVPRVRLRFEFGTPYVWLGVGDLPAGLVSFLQAFDPPRLST